MQEELDEITKFMFLIIIAFLLLVLFKLYTIKFTIAFIAVIILLRIMLMD